MSLPFSHPPSARDYFQQPQDNFVPIELRDNLVPPAQTLPNSPLIAPAPPTPPTIIIPGRPNPFYTPNTPASTPTHTYTSDTCKCTSTYTFTHTYTYTLCLYLYLQSEIYLYCIL